MLNNEKLFNKIETRARAIGNWKRLKILIVILRMCNGNFSEEPKPVAQIEELPESFNEKMAKYIVSPSNKYKVMLDVVCTLFLLLGFIVDTYIISFGLKPLGDSTMYYSHIVISAMYLLDIPINFVTAPRKDLDNAMDQL